MATKKKNQLNIIGEAVLDESDNIISKKAIIQPSKETAPVKKKDTGFFKSSDAADNWSLSTGNPMLDFIQRTNAGIWGTVFNAGTNVVRGATSSIEGVGDFAQNRVADIQDLFGFDKAAEKTRRKSEETWGVNKKIDEFNDIMNTTSILGDKSEGVFQGVGTSLLAMGTAGLGGAVSGGSQLISSIASLGTLGIGAAGSSENEARMQMMNEMKDKGYTTKQINDAARVYGLFSGTAETISEMMFGGISKASKALGIGKGLFDSADDAVISTLTKNIQNKIVKNLVQAGLKASGEGVEEVASGLMDAFAKKLTYMKDEDLIQLIKDEHLFDSFVSGTLSAYITQAPSYFNSVTTRDITKAADGSIQKGGFRLKTNQEIRDFITNLNEQEQQVVNREIENRIGQEEKVSKKRRIEIEKQVIEDLDRGYISANTIRDTLGENYNAERDLRLNESFNEEARRTQAYENDVSKYDEKQRKTIQTAIDSGLLNNSNKTHDFVDLIAKISADKDIDFDFTNNERIKDTGFAVEGKQVNGFIKDGTVNLNLESNQVLNKTVGHEITHVLEGTDLYNSLQDSLKSFIGEREWNNRISELEKTYKNVNGANIENELTSDLVGEYVFNDESFVRSLSTKNPNLFQKIFDEIKYMLKIATAGSKEARDLEKVKRAFEKAYRETSKTQQGTQYQLENQDEKYQSILTNKKEMNLGSYQEGLSKTDKSYRYNKVNSYDIKNGGRGDNVQVAVTKNGYIANNALLSDNVKGKGEGTKIMLDLNQQSLEETGYPLRSLPEYNIVGIKNHTAEGQGLWDSLVRKGFAVKNNDNTYTMLETAPTVEEYVKQRENNTKYSLTDNQNNENEKITLADGKTYNNYYEYAKDITKNKDELAKELLFKHYSQNFDVPANSNETKFYHGTDATFDYDGLKVMDFDEQTMDRNYGDYFYITTDKDFSHTYGSQIAEFIIPNDKILSLEDYRQNYSNKTDDELFNDYWALEMPDNEYIVKDIKPIIDYSKQRANEYINQQESKTKYSLSEAPKQDSLGRELSKEQQEYFKDSKARNDNGELEVLYHGSPTAGFTQFGPQNGEGNYRYGDRVITFLTDSKGTAETYSPSAEMVDTRRLESVNDAKSWLKGITEDYYIENNNVYDIDGEQVLSYENAEDLMRNLKRDMQKEVGNTEAGGIYEVYANITNPYVIENEKPVNWNQVQKDYGDDLKEFFSNLTENEKNVVKDIKGWEDWGLFKDELTRYYSSKVNGTFSDAYKKGGYEDTLAELGKKLHDLYDPQSPEGTVPYKGMSDLYDIDAGNYSEEAINKWAFREKTTNDIVNEVLEMNDNGSNYDGVIFKNVTDFGTWTGDRTPSNVYVSFDGSQIKAVDNLNPTNDADIRYQLGNNEVAPTSGWNVRSEDVRLQSAFKEAIAPLQEQVQELTKTIQNIVPSRALTEEEANEYATQTQEAFENEPAPIRNNLTEEENRRMDMLELLERNNMLNEEQRDEMTQLESKINPVYEDEEISPVDTLNDVRDIEEVGSPKVKAYQYEHPEVKPFFQEEARRMLSDLDNTQPAQRYAWESQERGQGTSWEFTGTKRLTSPEIAELKDSKWNYTYDDIRKGLNAIIEDHGAENIAVAKRIEFYLDERLRNGYDAWGVFDENGEQYHVEPNQDYLNMLAEQEWQNYFDDINSQYPLEQLQEPQYNLDDEETDFSDVSIDNDIQNMTADDLNLEPFLQGLVKSSENQAERQQLRNELNEKREVKVPKNPELNKAKNRGLGLLVNEFAEIDDYSKRTGNKNIKFKADTYNNYQAIAQSNIETAQTDINGKAIGRSGNSIFEEAKSLGLEDTFDEYLKQWANVDRAKQGKGAANYSAQESYKIVKEMEAKHPVLKRLGKDMWQYYRNARHNLRDAGIISQEVSDVLGRMYPHYTPYISENIQNYFTDEGKLKPKQTIKRAKGGAIIEGLLSAEEAMQRYTKSEFNTIFGNDLYREIINTSNDIVKLGGDERGMNYVNADNLYADKDGYYLTAYENGEPITSRISEEMYRTLTRESRNRISDIENTFSAVTKPLQGLSKLRRNILTSWSPTFIAKNFIKDFQEGIFNSKYTKDFSKNFLSGNAFRELKNNTELAQQFKSLYGSGLTMGQYDIDSTNYTPSGKNKGFLQGIKNFITGANELIELAPRYAEFKASLENGTSLQEAMYNAREVTTNFSRGGTLAKALNRNGFTFLNSSIQGFDKFIRNFSGENGAKGIVNSLAKAAIFGIAPAVFNELVFGSGDDKDEEYEALPDYIKDNYYIIKTGNGNFIRIPKGRVLSVFGSAARRTLELAQGEENAFEGFSDNVWQQIGINNPEENNIFAPLLQAMGGRKLDSGQTAGESWYHKDIIPSRLQKERPEDQYDASIDNLSIWLGQRTGISPYKINYVLDQYTGGIGDIVLPRFTPEANSDGSLIAPIKDQFTADTITDNKYVSEFYDTKGKLYTGSKATDEDILKNKYMNSISSEMAKLYAERREVQASDLSKKEKYAKSQEIKAEINRLAKEGMDNYNNVIMSNNYAKIGDTEYYKNANGEWKVTTDDVSMLGLDAEEKSEYYKVKNDIYTTKKENDGNDKPLVVQDIINSNLTPDAKVNLYTSNYKDDLIQPLVDSGMDVDSYLTYKSQNFTADKDSNGNSINGSKKRKVFDYINSMNIPYEQKLILAKSEYNSFNDNNYEILEYINNSPMTYDEKMTLISNLGFKVDGNNVSW